MTGLAAALLSTVLILMADSDPEGPLFHSESPLVLVPVTVTDRYARTVEGLRAENFSVVDNGQSRRISSFGTDDAPASVGIVLDVSGSMQPALAGARDTLRTFFATSNPLDEYMLLTVSTEPSALSGFTRDTESLRHIIELTYSGGMTSLIDAAWSTLKGMKEAREPRRALLILSDGFDNHSRYSQSQLIGLAVEADVQVYCMIFNTGLPGASGVPFRPAMAGKSWDVARERQGPEILKRLSEKTGGLYFNIHNQAEMQDAVVRTARALRSEYLIGFRPADSGPAGTFHRIRVKSNVPGLTVHARNGYYAR